MMEIEAVEKTIMQSVLKSVMDYNSSIEMLEPAVKKYFKDHYDEDWCYIDEWHLVDGGNNIKLTYVRDYLDDDLDSCTERKTVIIPTETIVSIAVDLSLNKRL